MGEYRKQLAHLDPVTRKQLEEGDWDVQLSGGVLDVTRLKYYTSGEFRQRVRYWDFAATEQKEDVDSDWTAGVLMGVENGEYQVQDVQRFREGPAEVEVRVRTQAQLDGPSVPVRIEEEPGSSGTSPHRPVVTTMRLRVGTAGRGRSSCPIASGEQGPSEKPSRRLVPAVHRAIPSPMFKYQARR